MKYGLIPELVGRLPVVATLAELDEAAMIQILTEPKNALIKQYRRMFEMDGAELEFTPEALKAIVQKAQKRKTGARGLRSILEEILIDTMYELPSLHDVEKVVIDGNMVTDCKKPLIVHREPAKTA